MTWASPTKLLSVSAAETTVIKFGFCCDVRGMTSDEIRSDLLYCNRVIPSMDHGPSLPIVDLSVGISEKWEVHDQVD